LVGKKVPAPYAVMPENSDPSGSRATSQEANGFRIMNIVGAQPLLAALRA
jgi:hypothetical protein